MNKRNIYLKLKKQIYWPFLAVLLYPFTIYAAEEKPPAIAEMWEMEVAGKDSAAFEEAFRKHAKKRAELGEKRRWQVYTPHAGSDMNRYIVRTCCFTWADKDSHAKWGEETKIGKDWANTGGKYVKKYKHHYSWIDHANANWPNDGKSFKYIGVRTFKIKHGANVSDSVKEVSQMAKDMGWNERWGWAYSITGPSKLNLVFPFENFSDMTPPSPSFGEKAAEHLGSEDKVKEVFDKFDSNFLGSTYQIYHYRDDLSSPK